MKTTLVSIVLPVLNESQNIDLLSKELEDMRTSSGNYTYEFVWVNDGSTDDSLEVLKSFRERFGNHHKIINFRRNFGQSAAYQAGFDYTNGDLIVCMDSDMQHNPSDLPKILDYMVENPNIDLLIGWARGDEKKLAKKLISKIGNVLIKILFKTKFSDRGYSGFKVFRKELVNEFNLYGEQHRFIPEIATMIGANIKEIEIGLRPRKYGKSKYSILKSIRVFFDILYFFFIFNPKRTPLYYFGVFSMIQVCIGICLLFLTLLMKLIWSYSLTGNPLFYATIILFLFSFQTVGTGIIADLTVRNNYNSKKSYKIRNYYNGEKS